MRELDEARQYQIGQLKERCERLEVACLSLAVGIANLTEANRHVEDYLSFSALERLRSQLLPPRTRFRVPLDSALGKAQVSLAAALDVGALKDRDLVDSVLKDGYRAPSSEPAKTPGFLHKSLWRVVSVVYARLESVLYFLGFVVTFCKALVFLARGQPVRARDVVRSIQLRSIHRRVVPLLKTALLVLVPLSAHRALSLVAAQRAAAPAAQ